MPPPPLRRSVAAVLVAAALALGALGGCSAATPDGGSPGARGRAGEPGPGAPCPVARIPVAVTVNQWHDVVAHSGGDCVAVTTILDRPGVDPHEYEPTPADQAALVGARLVVMNGRGYDSWATRALDAGGERPAVVEAATVPGADAPGGNSHLWNYPPAVDAVSRAVTEALRPLLPGAGDYLTERAAAWTAELAPYQAEVRGLIRQAVSKRYAATEPVYDPMAAFLLMRDVTPPGYRAASAGQSEPAPGDLAALQEVLRSHGADVLIYNTQTSGALPEQIRRTAEEAGVPVVEVSESVPPDQPGFVAWQLDQLRRLAAALGRGR
jgi:zinc/manganese transport system substrate-binding protein